MGVYGNPFIDPVSIVQDYIGSLACHAREEYEFLYGFWHLSGKFIYYHPGGCLYIPCFCFIEVNRTYLLLKGISGGFCITLNCFVFFKETSGDFVDMNICGLCGEYGGDKKFKWCLKFKRCSRFRILTLQTSQCF